MLLRLALAAALAGPAPPAPEGPAPEAPVTPERRRTRPAPSPSPDPNAAEPGKPRGEPVTVPGASAPMPGTEAPPLPGRGEPAEPPGAVPKIPSPRALSPFETGPSAPVTEDRLGALGLTRQRDGTMMYVDPGKRFTAVFNPDGTVRFGDRWNRDQHGNKVPGSRAALRQINMAGLGVTGPSEWLLGLQDILGGPERHAAAKREFLGRTAEIRTQMAVAWTLEILEYRLGTLERELFALWNAPGADPDKREILFQRWDECDEAFAVRPGGAITPEAQSAIDQARVETAEKARRIIEAFVRRQLPRPGPNAYTQAELAAMNARRASRQEFRPYDPPAE